MPADVRHPGVYVEEVPLALRAISPAATSITAFIGRAARGPVNVATNISSFSEFERLFGGLSLNSALSFAVRDFFTNGGHHAVVVRLFRSKQAERATVNAHSLQLIAASPGAWGNGLRVVVSHEATDGADWFTLTIRDGASGAIEQFSALSVDEHDQRSVVEVLADRSSLVRVCSPLPQIRPAAHAPPVTPQDLWADNVVATNSKVEERDQATDGEALTTADSFIPVGAQATKTGLYALEQVSLFNLLCIPPFELDVDVDAALLSAGVDYCRVRRALMVIDPPRAWTNLQSIKSGRDSDIGMASSYAAAYFPRLLQPNPLRNGIEEAFAPCGAVAGVLARTDSNFGVWQSPSGLNATLSGISGLSARLTSAECDELNRLGINCLRPLPYGQQSVWGARTRLGSDQSGSEWRYIAVRRTALFIEESVLGDTRWLAFEPNGPRTWAAVRLSVGAFMQRLFRQGAFKGATAAQAYFVKCDAGTTSQNDISSGRLNIEIGFALLKPGEFVIIRLTCSSLPIETS